MFEIRPFERTLQMPFKATSRVAAPVLLATLGFFALHCSSDEGSTNNTGGSSTLPTSGSGGIATGGSSAGTSAGGSTTGGSSAGTSTTAGSGGAAAGSGGAAGGSGGSAGGSGGSGGGSAGTGGGSGGGTGATFEKVKALLAVSCKGAKCHDKDNMEDNVDLVTADGLYGRLTTALPVGTSHCDGTVMVVPGNVEMSFLVTSVAGPNGVKVTCKKGNGTQMIAKMPDHCPDERPCLTEEQVKLLTDWVAGGAPM